jgi:hypothetical protein
LPSGKIGAVEAPWRKPVPEPDLPDHVLAAIERRVKRRVRRHVTMTLLTLALVARHQA